MLQWLELCVLNARNPGSISSWGIKKKKKMCLSLKVHWPWAEQKQTVREPSLECRAQGIPVKRQGYPESSGVMVLNYGATYRRALCKQ